MKITDNRNNRYGIFLFYDRDGIVDEYIIYMLNELKKNIAHLLVVCNGKPMDESLEKLKAASDEVLVRENTGFDVGGYREGLFHVGFDELQNYDEVILFNYTFFGGIYPFAEMFAEMDKRDVNFWGITKHHKVPFDPFGKIRYGYIPEHIQSHFLVIRKDMITSNEYQQFMENMNNPNSYIESICDYEAIFTKHFEDLGFKWDVYINTDRFENYAYCPIMFYTKDMLEKDRCPIIKRRSFFTDYSDYLINTCGAPSAEMYDFLCQNTEYDLNLIWDNILRLENLAEVKRVLHLNYCLPEDVEYVEESLEDIALSIWIKTTKNIEWYEDYLSSIPQECKIILVGDREDVLCVSSRISNKENIIVCDKKTNSYQEFLREVIELKDEKTAYHAFMVIDDIEKIRPYSNAISNIYKDWNCLFATKELLSNIKTTFSENPRMGMVIPPFPDFGDYFLQYADAWGGRFDEIDAYLKAIGIKANIKREVEPVASIEGNLWMTADMLRGEVLKASLNSPVDDNVFCLSLAYIIQAQKAYTGTVYNNSYAALEITNSDYMLRELNKAVFAKYGPNYHNVVLDRVKNNLLEKPIQVLGVQVEIGWKEKMKNKLKKMLPTESYEKLKRVYFRLKK